MKNQPRHGFTLVELSVVLVILGLLVGGVMAGQSLIRASELRSIGTDLAKYAAATSAFREKYSALPGDIPNATSYWGTAAGTGIDVACQDFASSDTATCNGNGDYQLTTYETFRYWQHLANAGLIQGQYTGVGKYVSAVQAGCYVGKSCPTTRYALVTMRPNYQGSLGDADTIAYESANYYLVGKTNLVTGTTNDSPTGAFLTAQEAWGLDSKIDDGKPNTGSMQTQYKNGATAAAAQDVNNCSIGNNPTDDYNLNRESASCAFRFLMM